MKALYRSTYQSPISGVNMNLTQLPTNFLKNLKSKLFVLIIDLGLGKIKSFIFAWQASPKLEPAQGLSCKNKAFYSPETQRGRRVIEVHYYRVYLILTSGAEGGHHRKLSRSGSIQEVIRKMSLGGTSYQRVQGEVMHQSIPVVPISLSSGYYWDIFQWGRDISLPLGDLTAL